MGRKLLYLLMAAAAAGALYRIGLADKGPVKLRFTFDQDRQVYEESDYGEPPQVAIWIEDLSDGSIRTVYATYRTATGDFYGKVECEVSLPFWIAAYRREFGAEGFPTPRDTAPDAITAATSREMTVSAEIEAARGKSYVYFIEMNVAGDFNAAFPLESADGRLDYHGNGQPSLIYSGHILAEPGDSASPEPYGRTDQYQYTGEVIRDLQGIDSAFECLKNIQVFCTEK